MRHFRDLDDLQDALDNEGLEDDVVYGELDEEDLEMLMPTKPKPKPAPKTTPKPKKKGKW